MARTLPTDVLSGAMPTAHIIEYDVSDQAAVESFFGDVWQDSRFPFDPEGAHSDLRRIPAEYQTNGGQFWLMRWDHQIIGTVAVRRLAENIAEVKRLNILRQHQGQGLGERLLRHALTHAIAAGYDAVRLDTIRNPGPALHLFEKCGFVESPRYNNNPDADLFMERDLRSCKAQGI